MNLSERRIVGISAQDPALWVDLTAPSLADLERIAEEFKIDIGLLKVCLNPEHLPKFEKFEGLDFFVLRMFDQSCKEDADTTQELTRKVVVFRRSKTLITLHRGALPLIDSLMLKWQQKDLNSKDITGIIYELFSGTMKTYDSPIDTAFDKLEAVEMGIFGADGAQPFELKAGYLLKRQSFVFKRMLYAIIELIRDEEFIDPLPKAKIQKLEAQYSNLSYYCEELSESITSLLNLQISLASQRTNESSQQTNEVIRVLTILSMFLLPLNVVTGIYGMNFKNMPELEWPHGYAFAIFLMLSVLVATYLWFRRKGWLKSHH